MILVRRLDLPLPHLDIEKLLSEQPLALHGIFLSIRNFSGNTASLQDILKVISTPLILHLLPLGEKEVTQVQPFSLSLEGRGPG